MVAALRVRAAPGGLGIGLVGVTPPVTVLFIVGWGRSGSTLLDQMLGELDGFFSCGELRWIWERGLTQGRTCGCGRPVRECPIWSQVLARGWPDGVPDPAEVIRHQRAEVRVPHTFRLLRLPPGPGSTKRPQLDSYIDVLSRLYPAIAATTGARVLVDSSKLPSDAVVLSMVAGIEPYFVHLVRDPRAVAYSWQRRKARLDPNAPAEMLRHGPLHSTNRWLLWNFLADKIRARNPERSLLLRYEDLVAGPRDAVLRIAALVGETPEELPFEGDGVRLSGNHTAAGNPSRLQSGLVTLAPDDEWRTRMSRTRKLVASSIAAPLLGRYGYPLIPGPLKPSAE